MSAKKALKAEAAPARECELKVEIDAATLKRVRKHPLLKKLGAGKATTKTLRSIYFDTPDQALKRRRIALRVRRVGDAWIQTVKRGGSLRAGLSTPEEVEIEVAGPAPELEAIASLPLRKEIERRARDGGLAPAFETRLRRTARNLESPEGAAIELALDDGEALAGERSEPIIEVELELKAGAPAALYGVAAELFGAEAARLSALSKAERGYRLAAGEAAPAVGAVKAGAFVLAPEATVEAAAVEILQSCAETAAENLCAIHLTDAPEAAHQYRVAVRRLRTALKLLRGALGREATRPLEEEARELFRLVGELRDADVLVDEMLDPATLPGLEGIEAARAAFDVYRRETRLRVREELRQRAATGFTFRLGAFIEARVRSAEAPKRRARLDKPARGLADAALARSWERAATQGAEIETLSVPERHELRKKMKDLRYTAAFFQSLYPSAAVAPFLREMRKLQNLFGFLNDAAMAEQMVARAADLDPTLRTVAAEVARRRGEASDKAWKKALARWKALEGTPRFWE